MKKSAFLALAVAPLILGAPMAAMANSVATDPVGYVKSPLANGTYTLVGVNLNKVSVYAAAVASATANTITVDASADLGSLLGAGPYYVEITSGALEGDRIDVASASGSVITLNVGAAHNTLSSASGIAAGSTIVIRPHYTFADFRDDVGNLLGGSGASNSDQLLVYDGGFVPYFFGSDDNWYTADGLFTNVNNKPIAPGSGVLFYANPAGGARTLELLTFGEVRNNDVVLPLTSGYQIISAGFPMDLSPAQLMMTTDYLTGGSGTSNSDQILIYDGGFVPYFLGSDSNWYTADGSFTSVTNSSLFGGQGAVLLYVNVADPDFRVSNKLQ